MIIYINPNRMPWNLQKSGSGYYVITTATGKKHSKHPLPRERAERQLKALGIHLANEKYQYK